MDKILYVGVYDSYWRTYAYELVDTPDKFQKKEFVSIDLPDREIEKICEMQYDYSLENFEKLDQKVKEYDVVYICEDGEFNYMDLKRFKNE